MLPYLIGFGSFLLFIGVFLVVIFYKRNKATRDTNYYKIYKKISLAYSWIVVVFFIGIITLALLLKSYYVLILLSVVLILYFAIIARIAHYLDKN